MAVVWNTVTFSAGNFTASIGGWTVSSGNQVTFRWRRVGKTFIVAFTIRNTSVTGTSPCPELRIAIPLTRVAVRNTPAAIFVNDNGTPRRGYAIVQTQLGYIACRLSSGGNFALSAGTTSIEGEITFEID